MPRRCRQPGRRRPAPRCGGTSPRRRRAAGSAVAASAGGSRRSGRPVGMPALEHHLDRLADGARGADQRIPALHRAEHRLHVGVEVERAGHGVDQGGDAVAALADAAPIPGVAPEMRVEMHQAAGLRQALLGVEAEKMRLEPALSERRQDFAVLLGRAGHRGVEKQVLVRRGGKVRGEKGVVRHVLAERAVGRNLAGGACDGEGCVGGHVANRPRDSGPRP